MSVTHGLLPSFAPSDFAQLEGMSVPWRAEPAAAPLLLALNEELAVELGMDPEALRSGEGVAVLVGNATPDGAAPLAQAYAGHQFGHYSPRLGDGRALLLGEVVDAHGRRRDVHLKGSGPTPFARGGDGRAAVGPMLREYVIGEAMHALGIPTTRALAVVATGATVARETALPGAVLVRVASSHLRVGTFQYAAATGDRRLLQRLADHAIARHHPQAADDAQPYLALYEAVVEAQASLIARWMLVGFVHGVMNTDNVTISGETIDYGPCAFMDAFDRSTVFSSIDVGGRYAYGNQPVIAQWDLARLAEALLPLLGDDAERAIAAATPVLESFPERYERAWASGMGAKLGLADADTGDPDPTLATDLVELMESTHVDHTSWYRTLAASLRGDEVRLRALVGDGAPLESWVRRWRDAVGATGRDRFDVADAMDAANPVYVPRNHLVEEALAAATDGDLAPFRRLVDVVSAPFDERPGLERYAEPAPPGPEPYRTFCGT